MSIFSFIHGGDKGKDDRGHAPSVREALARFSDNVEEDKQRYPEDGDAIDSMFKVLKARYRSRASAGTDGQEGPQDAAVSFFLSEDRLRAYACIFPPIGGGEDVDVDGFLASLRREGVVYGILDESVQEHVAGRDYLHIFPIAAGILPEDGEDAQITELFQHYEAPNFEAGERDVMDFAGSGTVQLIRAGDVICQIQPAGPGREGADVTGWALPCKAGLSVRVPMGKNTRISGDGLSLTASADGLLYYKDELFCVLPMQIVDSSLEEETDVLHLYGDVCVTGSVSGGAAIKAAGNIVICGEVQDASVTSTGGSIRIQQGVHGVREKTVLKAARQVQAPAIESAEVEAGGNVMAETVVNSVVRSGDTVNALGGEGSIVGCQIQAMHRVICQSIGSTAGARSRIMVGCDPQVVAEWEQNKKMLADTQKVMDKLWDNIGTLRRSQAWLNEEQRDLLKKLVEQRKLYEEKRKGLKTEKEALRQQMRAVKTGHVKCHQLFPTLEVQFGEHSGEVKTMEMECDIHLRDTDSMILLR